MVPTFAASPAGIPAMVEGIKRWTRSTSRLVHPASMRETIAVGACNDRGYRSTYSQYGEGLDIVAPSNDVMVDDRSQVRLDTDEVDLRQREARELAARLA